MPQRLSLLNQPRAGSLRPPTTPQPRRLCFASQCDWFLRQRMLPATRQAWLCALPHPTPARWRLTVSGLLLVHALVLVLGVDVFGLSDPVQVAFQVLFQLLLLPQLLEVAPCLGLLPLFGKLSGDGGRSRQAGERGDKRDRALQLCTGSPPPAPLCTDTLYPPGADLLSGMRKGSGKGVLLTQVWGRPNPRPFCLCHDHRPSLLAKVLQRPGNAFPTVTR